MHKTTTTLYWIRHGENPANLTKEFSYRLVDYPLTPKGVLQAQQTAEYFRGQPLDAIYCSPLRRAVQTAEIISTAVGLPVTTREEFRETNVGDLELAPPSAQSWAVHNGVLRAWEEGRRDVAFPGGEDHHTLWARMYAGLEYVVDQGAGGRVMVVAHGGNLSQILADLCPGSNCAGLQAHNHNCSITELALSYERGRLLGQVIRFGDYNHLHGEAADLVPALADENMFATAISNR